MMKAPSAWHCRLGAAFAAGCLLAVLSLRAHIDGRLGALPEPERSEDTAHGLVMLQYGYRAERILCWIMTLEKNGARHRATYDTWGQRCGTLLFVYGEPTLTEAVATPVFSQSNRTLMVGVRMKEGRRSGADTTWQKARLAYEYIASVYGTGDDAPYDWVLKANDDSYVFVENVHEFARRQRPDEPVYHGYKLKWSRHKYQYIQGAAYLMSRQVMAKLVGAFKAPGCPQPPHGSEDILLGRCFAAVNVSSLHAVDSSGRLYFSPTSPLATVNHVHTSSYREKQADAKFLLAIAVRRVGDRLACCSRRLLAFHHVAVADMWLLEYLAYRLTVRPFDGGDRDDDAALGL